jgi:16S rRNA processing protein RimM
MTSSSPSGKPDPAAADPGVGRPTPPGSADPPGGLLVGRVVGPFGRIGEVKLLPLTDFPERLAHYDSLLFRFPGGRSERRRLERARPHKGVVLLKLEGCESIDDAETLRGAEAWIDASQAAALPEGHYYVHDLIGLHVVTPDGESLGTVSEVLRGPANDVYVAGRYLIPATHDAIAAIDLERRRLIVRSREFLEAEEA